MNKKFKYLRLFLAIACIGFSGCKKDNSVIESSSLDFWKGSYPINTDVTLTYWDYSFSFGTTRDIDRGQSPYGQELEKLTGVKIKYLHPAAGQAEEQFNLLLASNDLPDIMEWYWFDFPGGPEKIIQDNYVQPLNELIEKNAPNLKKMLSENPKIDKMVKTDSGQYYVFPFLRDDDSLMVYQGPIVRKDWLDELGLTPPETISEWETVLQVFKEKKNAKAPLSFHTWMLNGNGAFSGAFGVKNSFYIEDNEIKFGQLEPGYKEFLQTMHKWYQNGWIDADIATLDSEILDANILSGRTGATMGNLGGGMGKWLSLMSEKDSKFDLIGVPYPVMNKGEIPKFGQRDLEYTAVCAAAISPKSKHADLAARYLDFGYTKEGHMLNNFGVENITYKMENDYPEYTELITKNPDGLSMSQVMERYMRAGGAPTLQDPRYMEQFTQTQQQKDAMKAWAKTDAEKNTLPRITPNLEESPEIARIMNNINTYSNEMFYKFILGTESLDKFDEYINQLKSYGIEKAVKIQQQALDRYNNR